MSDKRTKIVTYEPSGRAFTLSMPSYGEMRALEEEFIWVYKTDVDRAIDKLRSVTEPEWRFKAVDEGHDAMEASRKKAVEYQLHKMRIVAGLVESEALALDNDAFYWLLGEIDAFRLGVIGDLPSKLSTNMDATLANASALKSTPPPGETTTKPAGSPSNSKPVGPAKPGSGEWIFRRQSLYDSS